MINYLKKRIMKRNMEAYEINMEELKEKQKQGAQIIDVRSSQEYAEWHIDGSINIPYYEINNNIDKILKEKEIIVYCATGWRSKKAYKKLTKLNYRNVYNLHLGIENYL